MDNKIKPIKLIFCTDGIFPYLVGGMQRHSRLLIEAFAETGKVDLIVIHSHKERVFNKELNIKEITIKGIDASKNYLSESYYYSKRVYSVLEKYPDCIIYSQGLSVWYKIKEVSARLIINPHGLEPYQSITLKDFLISLPFRIIFNYLFSHSARVISLGGNLTNILKANIKDTSKIVILPNGINLPKDFDILRLCKDNSGILKILFIGRFAGNKGIDILLKAIRKLNGKGYADKITYYLAGRGPLYEYYTKNFKYENVNYTGLISDEQLIDLYRGSNLFVLPSLYEGMPTVILEAMSYGLPIIASDAGAIAELVDGSNGYLIERNNTDVLEEAIISFYNLSVEQRSRLSENSYNKAKNYFTWEYLAEKYIKMLKDLENENILKITQSEK